MHKIWRPALGFCAVLSACTAPPDPAEKLARPIVDGTNDKGDPSMVEFLAISGNSVAKCTATLVSPHVLLTAAHCVQETKGAKYAVFPGADDSRIASSADLLRVQAATYDPDYDTDPSKGHDLAIVALVNPLSAPIIPMNRAAITDADIGKNLRYVGYGLSDGVNQTGDGIKREGSAPLDDYNKELLLIRANAHNTCSGDSGGPLLINTSKGEAIAGITSFGTDQDCLKDSYFQRVDTQIAWIDQMIAKYDPKSGPSSDAGARDAKPADAETSGAPDAEAPPERDAGARDRSPTIADAGPRMPSSGPDAAHPTQTTPPPDNGGDETTLPPENHLRSSGCAYGGPARGTARWLALLGIAVGLRRRRRG